MEKPNSHSCLLSLLFLVPFLVQTTLGSKPETKYYKWDVEYMFWSPDCKEGTVMGINGQFPGPTIRARAGDTVVIDLTNKLSTEGAGIHWHGIRQFGTPWADGAVGVTQCPILPGETLTYKFVLDKAGTFFYHGHYGMQRTAGLYGSIIVDVAEGEKEPFHYDGEMSLLLSDWWHQSVHSQELGLNSKPFRWIGEPQSLLINGRGQFNCSLAAQYSEKETPQCKFREEDQCAPQILHVQPNKTYRVRVASTTSLASLNLAIAGHKMVVVEADGNYVKPFQTDDIDIYSGESYSFLLTTDQNPSDNYWLSVGVRGRKPNTPQGLTMLKYQTASATKLPSLPPPVTPRWDDYERSIAFSKKILAAMGSPKPPKNPNNRQIILLNTQSKIDGYTKWAINNVTLSVPPTPYLGSVYYRLRNAFNRKSPPTRFPAEYDIRSPPKNPNSTYGNGIYTFPYKVTVDVILQNANALDAGKSEIHPWHLHGHDFWVLGYGDGKFRPGVDEKTGFNLKNPPLRNTVVLYPYGWTALRFVTNNPGVWFFHCHIEPHLGMGMGVVFAEGVNRLGKVPKETMGCGMTAKLFMKGKKNV